MTELTKAVISAKEQVMDSEYTINKVCTYVYSYLKTKTKLNEDEQNDFILFFHPRIPTIISNFNNIGIPFEYYLNVHIKYQLLTFLKRNRQNAQKNAIIGNALFIKDIFDMYSTADFTQADTDSGHYHVQFNQITNKRLFFALLKCYDMFSENERQTLCQTLEIPWEEFISITNKLNDKTAPRKKRYRYLNERKNLAYFKMLQYQEKLIRTACTDDEKEVLILKIDKTKKTLYRLLDELKAVMVHPTHKEISEILSLPKGTIDSSLYYLRNAYSKGKLKNAA